MPITASYLSSITQCKNFILLASSCRIYPFTREPRHFPAGGRLNPLVSNYTEYSYRVLKYFSIIFGLHKATIVFLEKY